VKGEETSTARLASTAFPGSGNKNGQVTNRDVLWAKRAIVKVGVTKVSCN